MPLEARDAHRSPMNNPIVYPTVHGHFDIAAADRSLVRTARDDAPVLVAVHGGMLVGYAPIVREAVIAVTDGKLAIRVQAADDRKWRAAVVAVLAEEHDIARLGPATWLTPESVDALARLFAERAPACVAEFAEGAEVTLHTPTPSGTWVRLPGVVSNPHDIVVTATPINRDAADVVAAHWVGLPAFTDAGLAGFLINDETGHMMVRRVDHLSRARRRHDGRHDRPRGSRAAERS